MTQTQDAAMQRHDRAALPLQDIPEAVARRFWARIRRSDDGSGCWEWMGAKTTRGYGMVYAGGGATPIYAHRVSARIHHGAIPADTHVLHSCDNPSCVNPEHLSFGGHAENMREARDRRRFQQGAQHYKCSLTEEQVQAIREAEGSQSAIARRFSTSQSTVSRIRNQVTHRATAPRVNE